MSTTRLERAQASLREHDTDVLLVGPSPDLRWLIGYEALPLERLTLLVVTAEGPGVLFVPRLELPRAQASGAGDEVEIVAWSETDDPIALVARHVTAHATAPRIAVQDRTWSVFTLQLQQALATASWQPASAIMRSLRIVKSPDEVDALAAAAVQIDAVHAAVPGMLRVGRSERDVGREIAEAILDGHEHVNFVIVASGPNSASPHHETGDRRLSAGDVVVVDIGGTRRGYCSDVTRTYVVGDPDPGFIEMYAVLQDAQHRAANAVRPGVTAAAIDAAAREPIRAAGFGEEFLHRTGHGIGIEEHEEPWIVAGNDEVLRPGMAFSVEPGIYLEGVHGARIEDIVVVTDNGVRCLNDRPRELIICPG